MKIMGFKIGDRVRVKSLEWYNNHKNGFGRIDCSEKVFFESNMSKFCGSIVTIKDIDRDLDAYEVKENSYHWTDEMFEECTKEETPKFKVNDIVFVINIGWVKITNSYRDSFDNEYIYEAIGLNGGVEYDNINQSNIEYRMLFESENPDMCGNKITLDEYKNNDKEWLFNKLAILDNITALESIQDIFNHLKQSKYPKSYYECRKVLDTDYSAILRPGYKYREFEKFQQLIICRDAYWKIAGEEMGLNKPWKQDYDDRCFIIVNNNGNIHTYEYHGTNNVILAFPTEEMRDAFYDNFEKLINDCKKIL